MIFLISSFTDFFTSLFFINESSINNKRFIPYSNEYFIHDSFFKNLGSLFSFGGAIFINSTNIKILFERCDFINCSSFQNGGAIYSKILEGGIVLNQICISNCFTLDTGLSIYSYTYQSLNYIILSSISNSFGGDSCSIYLYLGYQNIKNINSSKNNAIQGTSLMNRDAQESNISYSSFSNNIAINFITIWYNGIGLKYSLIFSNIINNTQYSLNYGTIYSRDLTKVNILECIFKDNYPRIFSVAVGGTIYIENCYSDSFNFHVTSGIISFNNTFNFKSKYIFSNFWGAFHFCPRI